MGNTNHTFIAKLAKNDYINTISTTNFDTLIEKALENNKVKYKSYYDESHFAKLKFSKLNEKVVIYKIHGTVDDYSSIRTTLRSVASKSLSQARSNVLNYLFSIGQHDVLLILGYSCSDIFDISPHIQRVNKKQKQIILVEHSESNKIEDICKRKENNPFQRYQGKRIFVNTNHFVQQLWMSVEPIIGKYEISKSVQNFSTKNTLIKKSDDIDFLKYQVTGYLYDKMSKFYMSIEYFEKAMMIAQQLNQKKLQSQSYIDIGNTYFVLCNYKEAKRNYELSFDIIKNIEDEEIKDLKKKIIHNLGNCYMKLGDLDQAFNLYLYSKLQGGK